MTFQRVIIGLLILIVGGLAGAFYIEWKMSVQLRAIAKQSKATSKKLFASSRELLHSNEE